MGAAAVRWFRSAGRPFDDVYTPLAEAGHLFDSCRREPSMPPPKAPRGKSLVVKRSARLDGHKTSVTLEDAFWNALKNIAAAQETSLSRLVATIDSERQYANLSSAVRLFVLEFYHSRMRS
jgi:predicted DNA-binding ribbon-helix-helix protein